MIKRPSIAANIFNDHFCSIHRTFSNTAPPGSNVHVDRLKIANHSKLQNKNFKIPFVTCAFVEKQLAKLDIMKYIQAQKKSYSVSPYVILFVGINILIMFLKPATHISICWQESRSIYLCKTEYYCRNHTFYLI